MKKSTVLLDLSEAITEELLEKEIHHDLSAATRSENYLWIAGDENLSVQRLEKTGDNSWGKARNFHLSEYIELLTDDDEADIEGMDFDGRYLWITGSHSLKRSNIKANTDNPQKEIRKLTKISLDPNRVLLLRIPCQPNEQGEWVLHKACPDPDDKNAQLVASKLKHGKKKNELIKALEADEHLKDFLKIPGKDNGLDIEGLAAYSDRIFLGLRGPVLRGWAILLEIRLKQNKKGMLKLCKISKKGERYRKFFVDLHGMGVRELAPDGKDLLILAGPTMDLDGSMAIYRWPQVIDSPEDRLIAQKEIQEIFTIPYRSTVHGVNKAEGMVMLENGALMLVYDSPSPDRIKNKHTVKADLIHLHEEK